MDFLEEASSIFLNDSGLRRGLVVLGSDDLKTLSNKRVRQIISTEGI